MKQLVCFLCVHTLKEKYSFIHLVKVKNEKKCVSSLRLEICAKLKELMVVCY